MFEYDNIYIKSIEEDDLNFLSECRNDPDTWKYLGTLDFSNNIRQIEWLKKSSLDKSKAYFVLYKKGTLSDGTDDTRIGFVRMDEMDHLNRSIRIGGDIHPHFRGQGLGAKMYELLLKYCFDFLNMHRVWLLVIDYNKRAYTLYNSKGFKLEGTQREAIFRDGKYYDYLMMSILDTEYKE